MLTSDTLSSTEAANFLNLRIDYTLMLVRSGVIAATKRDGQWAIERSAVEEYRGRQNLRRLRSERLTQQRKRRSLRRTSGMTAQLSVGA